MKKILCICFILRNERWPEAGGSEDDAPLSCCSKAGQLVKISLLLMTTGSLAVIFYYNFIYGSDGCISCWFCRILN